MASSGSNLLTNQPSRGGGAKPPWMDSTRCARPAVRASTAPYDSAAVPETRASTAPSGWGAWASDQANSVKGKLADRFGKLRRTESDE